MPVWLKVLKKLSQLQRAGYGEEKISQTCHLGDFRFCAKAALAVSS
jgi:hypothetical protein